MKSKLAIAILSTIGILVGGYVGGCSLTSNPGPDPTHEPIRPPNPPFSDVKCSINTENLKRKLSNLPGDPIMIRPHITTIYEAKAMVSKLSEDSNCKLERAEFIRIFNIRWRFFHELNAQGEAMLSQSANSLCGLGFGSPSTPAQRAAKESECQKERELDMERLREKRRLDHKEMLDYFESLGQH
jgi:hypothetical protein